MNATALEQLLWAQLSARREGSYARRLSQLVDVEQLVHRHVRRLPAGAAQHPSRSAAELVADCLDCAKLIHIRQVSQARLEGVSVLEEHHRGGCGGVSSGLFARDYTACFS